RHDALGVADGVGGWSGTQGANPGEFSRKIMHYACAELEKYDDVDEEAFSHYYEVEPIDILERSYILASRDAQDEGIVGSTTACLAILRDDELRVANLGDCGLTVVRAGHFVFRTEEQQHSFNFPYQLGTGSPDQPSDAQSFRLRVQRGDVIILGSDGIFDNLFDEDILETVTACAEKVIIDARKVSQVLAQRAKDVSEDARCGASPFQSRAIAEGLYYSGGKVDDISVVVAVVADSEDSPDRR
ncbi:MAG: phosphatase 2C-like domain-containing protein, partial [Piptocephalis tieghemiana]